MYIYNKPTIEISQIQCLIYFRSNQKRNDLKENFQLSFLDLIYSL